MRACLIVSVFIFAATKTILLIGQFEKNNEKDRKNIYGNKLALKKE